MDAVGWGAAGVAAVLVACLVWFQAASRHRWTEQDDRDLAMQAPLEAWADRLAAKYGIPRDQISVRVERVRLCQHWRCRALRARLRVSRWWKRVAS